MKVSLVFQDWKDQSGQSIYISPIGNELSMGVFHSGSTFSADIRLGEDDSQALAEALKNGFQPVFYVSQEDEDDEYADDEDRYPF
jgi:hypothetical protein